MALKDENISGLVLFTHIHRLGSLSAAAQLLNISRSSVSKQLTALEKKIGARLFNRTTRKIMLTDVGRQVLNEAHKVELALQSIEHISEISQSEISGTIKISCASAQGRIHLVPLISRFIKLHPKVRVNVQLEDRLVDMVAENIDLSIRVGFLENSTMIARKLGDIIGMVCASPDYLSNALKINTPSDLLQHRCLYYQNSEVAMNRWTFEGENGEECITVSGPLSINDPDALQSAACDGAGVLLSDRGLLSNQLNDGRLVPILTNYKLVGSLPVYAVYPDKKFVPAKTRALLDFLLKEMPGAISGSTKTN